MLAVRIPDETEARLNELARPTGRPKSFYVRADLEAHLEEIPETYTAFYRLEHPAKGWTLDDRARRELRKLDATIQLAILCYLRDRIGTPENPRRFGKPLRRNLAGLWRYRSEDFRLICRIEDEKLVVLVLQVDHRSEIYVD